MQIATRQSFYLLIAVFTALIAEILLAQYVWQHGFDFQPMLKDMLANLTAQYMLLEVVVITLVYLVWMLNEANARNMKHRWIYVLLTFIPSPAVSLPVFLYMRERRQQKAQPSNTNCLVS